MLAQGGRGGGGSKRETFSERVRPIATTQENTNGRFQSSNIGSSSHRDNNGALSVSGRGRVNGGGVLTGGQRGGRWGTDASKPEKSSQGRQEIDHRMTSPKYEWEGKQDGLTDLGKKKYSTSWLLERKEMAQGGICDLPDTLHKHNLSISSQNRRYTSDSGLTNPAAVTANEEANAQEPTGKSMEKKDYTTQRKSRGFQSMEANLTTKGQKNIFPRQRGTLNNEKPAHHDNLFSTTTAKPSTTGVMAAVAEAMNVQSRPSANVESHSKNRSRGKEEYSYKKNPNHRGATVNRTNFQETVSTNGGRNKPHEYHGSANSQMSHSSVNYTGGQREFNSSSLANKYREAPQKQQFNTEQPRFSISSLKDSEREKVMLMLREKLRKYSVPPSRLAYASASASKLVKMELKTLGYVEVPTINPLNDMALTREEITVLSFQHEIRKHYRSAIHEANEGLTKYREYLLKTKKKRRYGNGQYF